MKIIIINKKKIGYHLYLKFIQVVIFTIINIRGTFSIIINSVRLS